MYREFAKLTLKASICAVPLLTSPVAVADTGGATGEPQAPAASAPVTPQLGEVVVSAEPPQDVPEADTVGEAEVSHLRAATSDTATLLRDVPGVSLYSAGGVSSLPAIRGLADDRLRIKVDGMDLVASCPNHMNPPLSYLDPTSVSKIKVYSGITPVSVGGDSIGGTIIAETEPPVFAEPGQGTLFVGEIGGFYRSNGNAYGGNVSATAASDSISLSYTGAYAKSDNYTAGGDFKPDTAKGRATGRIGHTLPLDEVGSTAYETQTQTLGIAVKSGAHLVEAELGLQNIPEQLFPNQRMDMLDNEQKRFNLHYLGQFDWGTLDARAFYETVDHFMDFGPDKRFWYGPGKPPAGSGADVGFDGLGNGYPCSPISGTRMVMGGGMVGCAAGMPMYTESETIGITVAADIPLGEQDLLRVGAQYLGYRLDDWWPASGAGMWPGTFDNINDGQRDRFALYGEWESHPATDWTTLLGVRYERVAMDTGDVRGYSTAPTAMGNQYADAKAFNSQDHEHTDNNVDLTALGRYTLDANTDIELGVARKVRSPNLYELYTWSTWSMAAVMNNFVGDGNGYIGNLDLEPEKAYTASATVDWHAADRSWELKATPFYTYVADYIDAIRCERGACPPDNPTATDKFVVLQYVNQSARLYGFDLSGRVPLAKNDWGEFGLTGLLNYTNGKNRDTDDELYNIMPLNAKVALTHRLGGWDGAVEVVAAAAKDDISDVRNEIKTSGYSLANLRGSYSWKSVRVDVGVDNLFDRFYSLPLGGAYVGQGTTMALNGIPWGIAVPGMGRSIYAGVTLKY